MCSTATGHAISQLISVTAEGVQAATAAEQLIIHFKYWCANMLVCILLYGELVAIRDEIREIEDGKFSKDNNVLKVRNHNTHIHTLIILSL